MAAAATLTGCDENSWNKHIDGFDEINDEPIADVRTIDYTLTAADYNAIATNATNKALAGEEGADALAAVGKNKCFSEAISAADYVPAFLESTSFPYFTLTDGSAVKLTYNLQNDVPAAVAAGRSAQAITIADDYYADEVWYDTDDHINAFAPSHPAENYLAAYLADYADPAEGTVCVVTYNNAQSEPVFGGADQPVGPVDVYSKAFTDNIDGYTIDNKLLPPELEYVWSYGGENYGAKAAAYKDGTSYATESWLISPEVSLDGVTDITMTFEHVVNKFPSAEFAREHCTMLVKVVGTSTWTPVAIPQYTNNNSWTFGASGDIDLNAFQGKNIQFAFRYVSLEGQSGTWEIKNLVIKGMPAADNAPARASALQGLVINKVAAAYAYSEETGEWSAADYVVLQPDTYSQMGQSHANLATAEPYLSTYLALTFPYAPAETVKNVLWFHYAGGSTSYDCTQYVSNGTAWTANNFVTEETAQFVRNAGHWLYNPNVTLVLPAGKNQELSTLYFQACVDWVYENICVPLGDTSIKSGKFYVTSYGNNEYYSGTSAYQGNVDLRADKAREQYPAGYEGMTDDQIVTLMKERFMNEVMPGALARLHPDAAPIPGIDLLYTITFGVYTGTSTTYTAVFKVTAPATFEPVSCTWDNPE